MHSSDITLHSKYLLSNFGAFQNLFRKTDRPVALSPVGMYHRRSDSSWKSYQRSYFGRINVTPVNPISGGDGSYGRCVHVFVFINWFIKDGGYGREDTDRGERECVGVCVCGGGGVYLYVVA